jgi:hypothetical protein
VCDRYFFRYIKEHLETTICFNHESFFMAKQAGPLFLERTIGNLIFYKMDGQYYVRMKPCFPNIRRSPRFRGTMRSARRMGRASAIGSALYAALPEGLKQFDKYRALTGEAFYLLKAGKTDEEALAVLWARQKDLVERGCAIAAEVYEGLGVGFRREWMLWAFAEEAMAMLKEGKPDEAVQAVLWKLYAREFEAGYREEGIFLHELPMVEEEAIQRKRDIEMRSEMVVLADGSIVDSRYAVMQKTDKRRYIEIQTLLERSQERRRAGPGSVPAPGSIFISKSSGHGIRCGYSPGIIYGY